jgi:nucleoside-diphosphate-sugar epimerase
MTKHVILGTGPIGCWTARVLVAKGHDVQAVNRSGVRPDLLPAEVELVAADVRDRDATLEATKGATSILQMLGLPYPEWPETFPVLQANALAAAEAHGARYLSFENLYMYDASKPIHERSPIRPLGRKGALRERMAEDVLAAHEQGRVKATILRASDFFGPGVHVSLLGDAFFKPLLAGKPAQWIGDPDVPHSVAYAPDIGRTAAELATYESSLGKVWFAPHAQAVTPQELVNLAAETLGVQPALRAMGPLTLRLGALFRRDARELIELMPNLYRPYLVDARSIDAVYSIRATPLRDAMEATVAWFRKSSVKA